MLTKAEEFTLIHKDDYFDEDDVWYGMKGFLFDKWDNLSDRLRFILESLPKYTCDLDRSMLR
jgi:hypothetical protein